MALGDVIARLAVSLNLDTSAFEKGSTLAQKQMAQTQRKFSKIGKQIGDVGKSMSLSITAPLVGIGAAAVRVGNDFEKAMANVSTLVDESAESMDAMKSQVLGIAQRVPVAMGELTSALYDVRSAGISAADSMKVLEGSAKLGVAGLGTTKEATNIVTSAINAFGLKGEEAEKIYDNVFRTVKAGKTTISELGQSFGAVAPVVAQANIQVDEFLAATAALTTTGLPASQAQTQLRAAIAGLTRDTKETAAAFKQLGAKNFTELVQKSGGMVEAFKRLREATGNNDANLLKLVGSIEGYNAMVSLSGQTSDAFTETLKGMRSGINAVDEAFLKQAGTTAAKWQQTQNSLQVSAIKLNTILAPVLEKLADLLGKVADWFSNLSPAMQDTVVVVGGVVAALGPLLMVVGQLTTAIPLLSRALMFLFANPIILGAAALIGAIYLAWKNWDKITAIVKNLYTGVKTWIYDKLGAIWNWLKGKLEQVGGWFFDLYDKVVGHSYIPDMVDEIGVHMRRLDKEMVDPAQKAAKKTEDRMREMAANVRSILDRLFPEVARALQYRDELSALNGAKLGDQKDEALTRLRREYMGLPADPTTPYKVSDDLLNTPSLVEGMKSVGEATKALADKAKTQTVRIAESFKDMAEKTMQSIRGLADAIKGGGFLDILEAVIGLGLQLGSIGVFGKKIQKNVNKTPGYASGTNFHPGGLAMVGERGPELVSMPRGSKVFTNKETGDLLGGRQRIDIVPSPYFDVVVDGRVMRAGPSIAQGGAQLAAQQDMFQRSRRLA